MDLRRIMGSLLIALSMLVAAGPVWGESVIPPDLIHRRVPRDAETRVFAFWNFSINSNGICSARFIPTIELVIPPAHGSVRFVTADLPVTQRSGCFNNSVYGTAVMYRPNPGFVGGDQFTIKHPEDVMAFYQIGPRSLVDVLIIKVLDTPSGAAPTAPRP